MSPLKCFLRAIAFVRPCTWTCTFFRFCIYRCTCQGDNLKIKVIITNENDMFNSCQMGFVSGAYIRASAAGISLTRSLVIAWSFHLAVYLCLTKLKQLWVFVLQNFLIRMCQECFSAFILASYGHMANSVRNNSFGMYYTSCVADALVFYAFWQQLYLLQANFWSDSLFLKHIVN